MFDYDSTRERTEAGLDGDEGERDTQIFVNSTGELWQDHLRDGDFNDIVIEDWTYEGLDPKAIFVSKKEIEALEDFLVKPWQLKDFHERLIETPVSQFR
jgi:hypothetical protein